MTAAPGPQQPDEVPWHWVREPGDDEWSRDWKCCGGPYDEAPAGHYADCPEHGIEGATDFPAAPSAHPDEVRCECWYRTQRPGDVAIGPWHATTCPQYRPTAPAQPVRDTGEGPVQLPSGGTAHVSTDAPSSLLRALDSLSQAAQHDANPNYPTPPYCGQCEWDGKRLVARCFLCRRDTGEGRR